LIEQFVIYFAWPGGRWRFQNLPPTATGLWAAFGDSLTVGHGAFANIGAMIDRLHARGSFVVLIGIRDRALSATPMPKGSRHWRGKRK
jgi:hypothetical protein